MKNAIILIMLIFMACTAMASSGSFGEVAGVLTYNALITGPQTRTWTLVNNFNTSLPFYIVKPSLYGVTVITSVMNGTIQPNALFPINVTVTSNTTYTESGYINAYVGGNATGNAGGSQLRLGVIKLIEINGTSIRPTTTTIAQATIPTTIPQTQIVQASTTIPSTNSSTSRAGAQSSSTQSGSNNGISNLILPVFGLVVIAIAIGVGLGIAFSKRRLSKANRHRTRRRKSIKR